MRAYICRAVLLVFAGCPVFAQPVVTNTSSDTAAQFNTVNTTSVTQQVNTFSTEIKARMQGGSYLYDQTFSVAITDPSVQAAIVQAKSVLTGAGAVSFTGPTQLSSTQSTTSSTNTVVTSQTGAPGSPLIGVATWVGPATITVGNLGVCQTRTALTSGPDLAVSGNYFQYGGCSLPGTSLTIAAGGEDIDTQVTSLVIVNQTATTTNTTLTTSVYEIDGFLAGVTPPSATPVPPSILLALAGIGAAAGLRRWRGGFPGAARKLGV
jgi:hypothetical protein